MAPSIRRYPLMTFFFLAFGITWVVWVPRAAGAQLGVVGQVWTWAPAIAALLAAALTGGRPAVRELGVRLVRWRVGWQWYLVVILGPAAFSIVVAGVYAFLGGSWVAAVPPALRGETSLALLPLLLAILALTDGLGEELAWRGFALPRLLSQYNALVASLILGVLWALWHLPLVWTEEATLYQQPIWLLLLDTLAMSVLYTWVFLHTPDTPPARRGREVAADTRRDRVSGATTRTWLALRGPVVGIRRGPMEMTRDACLT